MNKSANKKEEYHETPGKETSSNDILELRHRFNDDGNPKYQTIIAELHDFFRLTLSKTIDVVDIRELECDNEKVAKFRELMPRMLSNCRELTQRKSYIPFESEVSENDQKQKKFQLLHQHQIVLNFQEFCNELTKLVIDAHVLRFLSKCNNSYDVMSKHWTSFHKLFEYVIGALGPIISYVHVNYPMIRKELGFKNLTVYQYYDSKLFESIKTSLERTFQPL